MTLPDRPSFDQYGGAKIQYSNLKDTNTDRTADQVNQAFADITSMAQVCPRAHFQFVGTVTPDNVTPIIPIYHYAMWGNTYAVQPIITRQSLGTYQAVFPATITTPLGTTAPVQITSVVITLDSLSNLVCNAYVDVGPANQVNFVIKDPTTGDPQDMEGYRITVICF